eukprot:1191605-Prorocentrum_minimum.AAC.2
MFQARSAEPKRELVVRRADSPLNSNNKPPAAARGLILYFSGLNTGRGAAGRANDGGGVGTRSSNYAPPTYQVKRPRLA